MFIICFLIALCVIYTWNKVGGITLFLAWAFFFTLETIIGFPPLVRAIDSIQMQMDEWGENGYLPWRPYIEVKEIRIAAGGGYLSDPPSYDLTVKTTYRRLRANAAICSIVGDVWWQNPIGASSFRGLVDTPNGLQRYLEPGRVYLGKRRLIFALYPVEPTEFGVKGWNTPIFGEAGTQVVTYKSSTPTDWIGTHGQFEWCKVGKDLRELAKANNLEVDANGIIKNRVAWVETAYPFAVENLTARVMDQRLVAIGAAAFRLPGSSAPVTNDSNDVNADCIRTIKNVLRFVGGDRLVNNCGFRSPQQNERGVVADLVCGRNVTPVVFDRLDDRTFSVTLNGKTVKYCPAGREPS